MNRALAIFGLFLLVGFTHAQTPRGAALITTDGRGAAGELLVLNFTWAANATGEATQATGQIHGTIVRVVIAQAASGEDSAPTQSYDIDLTDRDSVNLLGTTGDDIDITAGTKNVTTGFSPATGGLSTLAVTNAGASGEGTVRVFFRR